MKPNRKVLHAGARAYAAHGWAVFPCVAGTKKPATSNGFHGASRDPEVVDHFWRAGANNVAIATGTPSELWVLDLDTKKHPHCLDQLRAAVPEGRDLDDVEEVAHVVQTASGGQHWYFAYDVSFPFTIGAALAGIPGVDWRGDGGYVLAPPSYADGDYTWVDFDGQLPELEPAPQWFLNMITAARAPLDTGEVLSTAAPEGTRNETAARLAGKLLSTNMEPQDAWAMLTAWNQTQCKPPLSDKELNGIFQSIGKRDLRNNPNRPQWREQERELEKLGLVPGKAGMDTTIPTPHSEHVEAMAAYGTEPLGPLHQEIQQDREKLEQRRAKAQEREQTEQQRQEKAAERIRAKEERLAITQATNPFATGGGLPGWALEDPDLAQQAVATLRTFLRCEDFEGVVLNGATRVEEETYELRFGDASYLFGGLGVLMTPRLFDMALARWRGKRLAPAMKKHWSEISTLLLAICETRDSERGKREEALELLELCYRGGEKGVWKWTKRTPKETVNKKLLGGLGWETEDEIVLPWVFLRTKAKEMNAGSRVPDQWIRDRMMLIAEPVRTSRKSPQTGKKINVQGYRLSPEARS